MISEIVEVKISDLGEIITGNTPPTTDRTLYDGDYPLIMPTDIIEGDKVIHHTEETVSEKGFKKYKKSLIPANMPCVVTIGSIGKKLCLTKVDSFTNQAINAIIVDLDKYDPDFVFYLMKYNLAQVKNLSSGTASGRENVSKSSFGKIKVKLPKNLLVQKKIASILSAYDDLIENNNQRIQLLEDMASEIYKEWFVRFRFPNYKYTKFLDKEGNEVKHGTKGAIPEGWEQVRLDKYIDFEKGVEPGSKNYESEPLDHNYVPFLRVGDLGSRDSNIFINKELSKNKYVSKEDILITLDGTVGKVAMGLEGCYSSGLRKIVYKTDLIKRSFTYFTLLSSSIQGTIQAHAAGTTILHASSSIKFMKILMPKENLLQEFENLVKPMLDEILLLRDKNQILQDTRDLLLPRLISGKLSVENLEVEEMNMNMAAEPQEKYIK